MPGGAASGDNNPVDVGQLLRRKLQPGQAGGSLGVVQAPAQAVFERIRLLENLLLHKVRKALFFRLLQVPGDFLQFWGDRHLVDGGNRKAILAHPRDLLVFEINHLVGVAQDGGNVGSYKIFLFPPANENRRAAPRGDDFLRVVLMQNGNAVGALHLR